jgi:23S rRNA pseudouridine2605 synthase
VYRKFDAPRDRGERPSRPFSSDRPARPPFSSDRPARPEGSGTYTRKPAGDFAPRKFSGKPSGKPGGFAGKSGGKPGGFGGKKPYSKAGGGFGAKSTSTFAKFADNKKPFGNRPPARKFKPKEDESA